MPDKKIFHVQLWYVSVHYTTVEASSQEEAETIAQNPTDEMMDEADSNDSYQELTRVRVSEEADQTGKPWIELIPQD